MLELLHQFWCHSVVEPQLMRGQDGETDLRHDEIIILQSPGVTFDVAWRKIDLWRNWDRPALGITDLPRGMRKMRSFDHLHRWLSAYFPSSRVVLLVSTLVVLHAMHCDIRHHQGLSVPESSARIKRVRFFICDKVHNASCGWRQGI